MDPATQHNVDQWLNGDYDPETKSAIQKMLKEDPKGLVDAFYTHLSFGTGGLRGIMGLGTNRMNRYTVSAATQGLANYLLKQLGDPSVFIGYDSRHHSCEFAEESAKVLAANGIQVFLFSALRPTPLVSFGCRMKTCAAAIMITASHNPPEYNGYKVFWNDGAQILPPHDKNIILEVQMISSPSQVRKVESLDHPFIHIVSSEIDKAYLEAIHTLQFFPHENLKEGHRLKVVYTNLHGTGITIVPKALNSWGFSNLILVDKQAAPDGDFPTVESPNPELPAALKLGTDKLIEIGADLLIANDPDTDRMGAAILHRGRAVILNGNQLACLLLEHVLNALTTQKRLPATAAFIKTIGTTELFQEICDAYQRPCINVLTGFKYFAEKIRQWETDHSHQFIFGGEESFGYLLGTLTRDKDAVTASALLCEAALQSKLKGETLVDRLHAIYRRYGFHLEKLMTLNFEASQEGSERMKQGMEKLVENPPQTFCGIPVETLEDYNASVKIHLATGKQDTLALPKSNVLLFWLQDGSKLMIRPSGTEPKIKIYCGVRLKTFQDLEEARLQCDSHANALMQNLKNRLQWSN